MVHVMVKSSTQLHPGPNVIVSELRKIADKTSLFLQFNLSASQPETRLSRHIILYLIIFDQTISSP